VDLSKAQTMLEDRPFSQW